MMSFIMFYCALLDWAEITSEALTKSFAGESSRSFESHNNKEIKSH